MSNNSKNALEAFPGAQALIARYGRLPSFHDSEVISLNLSRTGASILTLQPFPPDDPTLVHFELQNVTDLELFDFSSQNVISSLSIERQLGADSKSSFRISLGACYGISGWIEAEIVSARTSG